MNRSTPGLPVHHSNSHPSSRWCHPAISFSVIPFSSCPQSLPALGSFPVSQLFAWGGQSTDWSFSFSIIPSKEIPGLISFRKDWLDLLAVEGTLKSLLQHHSSKASILQRWAFFTSKYCISDSFVDHDGYSISSEGFLPIVLDIMVIWVKFTHSSPF